MKNCLNSIAIASQNSTLKYEVCISDNFSEEKILPVIEKYNQKINIILNRNESNIGLGANILKSVSLASGDYAWILGNDDIVLPESFNYLEKLFEISKDVDFLHQFLSY